MIEIVSADAELGQDPELEKVEKPANNESGNNDQPASEPDQDHDKVQKRIDKAIYEKHQARREAEQARAEASELRARLEVGQTIDPNDIQALVQQEAEKLRHDESFNKSCNDTYEVGVKEFGKSFDKAMSNLSLVGMNRDFLELVSTSDNGAKILVHLGGDLDEAERIANLSPLKMAREITKLDLQLGSEKVKKVSNAPEPIKPISGRSGGSKSPGEMTDAEYAKWRKGK
jgi:hypothetical protein